MKRSTKKAPVKKTAKKSVPAKAAKTKPSAKKSAKPAPPAKKTSTKRTTAPKKAPAKKLAAPAKKGVATKKSHSPAKKTATPPRKSPAPKATAKKVAKPVVPPKGKAKATATKGKPASHADQVKKLLALRNGNGHTNGKSDAKLEAKPTPPTPPPPEPPPASPAVIAARARLAKRKAPYKTSELKELREALTAERERLIEDLRVIDELATSNKETVNPTFSSHQADVATDSSSLETSFLQRRVAERRLSEVSEALRTMDSGRFGLCEACANEPQGLCETCPYIPLDRLRAKPFAQMCVQLRRILEKNMVK